MTITEDEKRRQATPRNMNVVGGAIESGDAKGLRPLNPLDLLKNLLDAGDLRIINYNREIVDPQILDLQLFRYLGWPNIAVIGRDNQAFHVVPNQRAWPDLPYKYLIQEIEWRRSASAQFGSPLRDVAAIDVAQKNAANLRSDQLRLRVYAVNRDSSLDHVVTIIHSPEHHIGPNRVYLFEGRDVIHESPTWQTDGTIVLVPPNVGRLMSAGSHNKLFCPFMLIPGLP